MNIEYVLNYVKMLTLNMLYNNPQHDEQRWNHENEVKIIYNIL